ncbi:MAG: hypothetical protein F9K35_12935 [Burkholderiaceae bacterium]|nr:MAG: hypothetical protein F9K35_12935 [Burkholderiaceae bacterium]
MFHLLESALLGWYQSTGIIQAGGRGHRAKKHPRTPPIYKVTQTLPSDKAAAISIATALVVRRAELLGSPALDLP